MKISSFIFFLLLGSTVFVRPAHAQAFWTGVMGGMGTWLFNKVEDVLPDLDIRRTTESIAVSLATGTTTHFLVDRNLDELSNCYFVAADVYEANGTSRFEEAMSQGGPTRSLERLDRMGSPPVIAEMTEAAWEEVSSYAPEVCNYDGEHTLGGGRGVVYRGSGSVLAVASGLRQGVTQEPLPVNLASFTRDYARRVPIIRNTAYAQGNTDYNIIGEEAVFALWRLSRNIALGLMSIVLLVVGVMIMTRKKINPQAVVTLQNALPRVALGIVLVFFSFPIGAFFAALVVPLSGAALTVIFDLVRIPSDPQLTAMPGNLNVLVWALLNLLLGVRQFAVGLFSIIATLILLGLSLVLLVILYIKALFIYMKILVNIIASPIQFTLGVIPGKENATMDWFKNMIANVLSVPAMFLMMSIGWFFLFESFAVGWSLDATAGAGALVSTIFVSAFTPMICIFCLMTALRMPKKVQALIMGDKKR